MKDIDLGTVKIGPGHRPFIIAEMSGNHNQSLERAIAMVDAAAKAGVHAIKLQTYTAETMTLDIGEKEFFIEDSQSLWKGRSLYDLYQEAHTPWDWHRPIFERCQKHGIIFFSTPFDESAVDFLEQFQVPLYKIASFENIDLPLIKKVAATGKPLIISSGMATLAELDDAVRTARQHGARDIILLKCTSSYPAPPEHSNILTIPHMKQLFEVQVGLSDHTLGIGVALASVALGATVIEKHFTLRREDGGVDSAFSLEPEELALLVQESERAFQCLGKVQYGVSSPQEEKSKVFRRTLYVAKDMKKGEAFNQENLRRVRPGLGLPSKYFETALGMKAKTDIKRGTPFHWDLIG